MFTTRSDTLMLRAAMFASAAAAAIHLAVAHEHFSEWPMAGTFMILSGLLQLGWIAWAHLARSRSAVIAGLVANAAFASLWVTTRTVGLPIGPKAWEPEAVRAADALCTSMEALIIACALSLLVPSLPRSTRLSIVAALIGIVGAVAVAMDEPLRDRLTASATLVFALASALIACSNPVRTHQPSKASIGRIHVVEAPRSAYVLDRVSGVAIFSRSDAA